MNLVPVNDPNLLKQLNDSAGNMNPVTDPELLKQLNATETPGVLKSAGTGLISGIPGAETAISAVRSAVGPNTYEQEHQAIEDLKNKTWEEHPVAYGAGKTAGMIGTGAVAPEGLVGAAAVGAASGLDTATKPAEMINAAVKGGAIGTAAGVVGKGISKAIGALPGIGKGIVASLGKPTTEDVTSYLENPENINNAVSPENASNKLEGFAQNIKSAIGHLSDSAKQKLHPNSMVNMDEIRPVLDQIKQGFTTEGVSSGPAQDAAVKEISNWENILDTHAAKNNGYIPDTTLAEVVRDIRQNTNYNPLSATRQSDTVDTGLKQLSHGLDQIVKNKNPEYATAMEPVSQLADLSKKVGKTFGLQNTPGEGIQATDTTSSKLGSILKDNKSNAQETLQKLSDLTGYDFLGNAKNYATKEAFETPGAGGGTSALGHAVGYLTGRMSGVPGGGLAGSIVGGIAGHNIDGGQIAKNILDSYISKRNDFVQSGTKALIDKFGPVLANAAKQGGNSLAATHFVLATSNPQYQQLVDEHQNNQ